MNIRSRETGAAVVEFAVLCGLLLVFLFGIFEFGFLWLQSNYIASAAREGARVAAKIPGLTEERVEERETAAERAAKLYLAELFLFRKFAETTDGSLDLDGDGIPQFDPDDFIEVAYISDYAKSDPDETDECSPTGEKCEILTVNSQPVRILMTEVEVTVQTHMVWEPILWPLLSSLPFFPGTEYDGNKLKSLTQRASYAIQ